MKTAFTIILLSLGLSTHSQVIKLRAFETCLYTENDDPDDIEWRKADILVTVNLNINKINIYSRNEQDIDLIKLKSQKEEDNGDKLLEYIGIDQDGVKCGVIMSLFFNKTHKHIATIVLKYSNVLLGYRLEKDE